MRILGVDPGKTTGLALWESGKLDRTGTLRLRDCTPMSLVTFRDQLRIWLEAADRVTMERLTAHTVHNAEKDQVEAIVSLLCGELGLPVRTVAPNTARKAVVGNGRAKPRDIKAAVRLRTGLQVRTDHEADASVVALWAADQLPLEGVDRSRRGRYSAPSEA